MILKGSNSKNQKAGVPAMAQWDGQSLWSTGKQIPSGQAQWVKDPALLQLQCRSQLPLRSDSWPRNSTCRSRGGGAKRKKKKRRQIHITMRKVEMVFENSGNYLFPTRRKGGRKTYQMRVGKHVKWDGSSSEDEKALRLWSQQIEWKFGSTRTYVTFLLVSGSSRTV